MSKPNLLRGIRDGRLRTLAKAARKQEFELGATRHDHLYLRCEQCQERITFSKTVSETDRAAYPQLLNRLRKHGLLYEGQGGEHTAEPTKAARTSRQVRTPR